MKTQDALRSIKVFNTWELLKRFATKGTAVAVQFMGRSQMRPPRVQVWSPYFDTDKDAPWYNDNRKTFLVFRRDRKQTMEDARKWATKKYGIKEWGVCPTNRQTLIPMEVRKLALAAARQT